MRTFSISSRSLDRGSGGADGPLDSLLTHGQWIVRDVQPAVLDFCFDYVTQRLGCISYFLLAGDISKLINFDSNGHGFAQTRIGAVRSLLHVFLICTRATR
jgi:hypothetical protein